MFPPFPQDKAFSICKRVVAALDSGRLKMNLYSSRKQLPAEGGRCEQGLMIGVLVCKKDDKEISLLALSGTRYFFSDSDLSEAGLDCIFTPPLVLPEKIDEALFSNDLKIHELTREINSLKVLSEGENLIEKIQVLKKERSKLTDESLRKVFGLYSFHCIDGSVKSLTSICKEKGESFLPPTGTGECCEPKLLDYAFSHKLQPVSMCEVFFRGKGQSQDLLPVPPCDSRCAIVLPAMLSLDILYRDDEIIVLNKQSGLLSVPGRGPDKQDCLSSRIKRLFPSCIEQPAVHRLDMETSGLMVFALTKESHRALRLQFEASSVFKQYTALLDGALPAKGFAPEGEMELYFRLDVENRPHQIWDSVYGKKAVTRWKFLDVENWVCPDKKSRLVTRVLFTPLTGRTHQLRLASADSHGFASPILGDTLYGNCPPGPSSSKRLLLHASYLEFNHPVSGERMKFSSRVPF